MFSIFESKDEAMIMAGGIIIAALFLLAIGFFKASFYNYEKYLIVRKKFYSEAVQNVVDHVCPHHDQLKSESLRYLFWGFVWSIISAVMFFFVTKAGS